MAGEQSSAVWHLRSSKSSQSAVVRGRQSFSQPYTPHNAALPFLTSNELKNAGLFGSCGALA